MSESETPRELLIEAIMGAIASSTYNVQEMDAAIDALIASEVRAAKQAMPCCGPDATHDHEYDCGRCASCVARSDGSVGRERRSSPPNSGWNRTCRAAGPRVVRWLRADGR